MATVHPTALVDPGAELSASVAVGAYSLIGPGVQIDEGTTIGPHCVIEGHTRIGRDCRIFQFASLGAAPQDMKYGGEPTELVIGDRNTIREFCTFNRGTVQDGGVTRIGDDNWIMAYVHIAHDCQVGSHVILANNATLAGHVHLADWVERHSALLAADVTLWEFGGINAAGEPELICGLRGIATFELRAKTITHDAHSGVGGTILPNAAWRLVHALASLKDQNERILLPGHYDSVLPATAADLALLGKLSPQIEEELKAAFGISGFLGEATGAELHRRASFEPSCTINGLSSGYQGAGVKTVLPAEATAKLDFRLVPDMDPETVHESLRAHLDAQGFTDIEVVYLGGQKPGRVSPEHPLVQLAAQTAQDTYGIAPSIVPLSPVTGPVHPFTVGLRQPIATIGCGYPGARVHAPNENLRVSDLLRGAEHTVRFLMALAT